MSRDERFCDAYTKALSGPFAIDAYQSAVTGPLSVEDAGYLAGIKSRFGELPSIEFYNESDEFVVIEV